MSEGVDPRFEAELRRGVVQMVALCLLSTARYGYDLVRLLGQEGLVVEEGTLYPILRRFEEQGLLSARWDTAGSRPRKYYELSEHGIVVRDAMLEAWARTRNATDAAIEHALHRATEEGTP